MGDYLKTIPAAPARLFPVLLVIAIVLRVFYSGHLFADDGLWFTSAEQLLRGKALYREIYFDKPPVLPLVYAALFRMFGAHVAVVRLFTSIYATVESWLLYRIGTAMWSRGTAALAALIFTVYSTMGFTADVQSLSTDVLLVIPYTAAAALFVGSATALATSERRKKLNGALLAVLGGCLTGVAVQTNPKGVFDLVFFALLLAGAVYAKRRFPERYWNDGESTARTALRALLNLTAAGIGAAAGAAPFLFYLERTRSLSFYWTYVWQWGFTYTEYFSLGRAAYNGIRSVSGYMALNSTLAISVALFLVLTFRRIARLMTRESPAEAPSNELDTERIGQLPVEPQKEESPADAGQWTRSPDLILLLWFTCSFVAVAIGGRFFAHYFFIMLPALSLMASRGLIEILSWLRVSGPSAADAETSGPLPFERSPNAAPRWQRVALCSILILGFAVTVVRFHTRTAELAIDWFSGHRTAATQNWFQDQRQQDGRLAAARVRELSLNPDQVKASPAESIRTAMPNRYPGDSADYLFVWGYRPDIYYWSALVPASRYLSMQPITGVPVDVQILSEKTHPILPEDVRNQAMRQLLSDLEQTKPKYIVDQIGMYDSTMAITNFPGIKDFMRAYKPAGAAGILMVYRRRPPKNKAARAPG